MVRRLTDAAIPAGGGSVSSPWLPAEYFSRLRVVVLSKGADVTVKLEASPDEGTTVYELAANVTGVGQVLDLADNDIRLTATNAGAAAEAVDALLTAGG